MSNLTAPQARGVASDHLASSLLALLWKTMVSRAAWVLHLQLLQDWQSRLVMSLMTALTIKRNAMATSDPIPQSRLPPSSHMRKKSL